MVNVQTCHKCGSHDVDHATIGLPDAMQCLDCGHIFPQIMSLFPKVIKTESNWPFPTSLRPQKLNDHIPDTRDRGNTQEAPF